MHAQLQALLMQTALLKNNAELQHTQLTEQQLKLIAQALAALEQLNEAAYCK